MANPGDPDRDAKVEEARQMIEACVTSLDWAIDAASSIKDPKWAWHKRNLNIVRGIVAGFPQLGVESIVALANREFRCGFGEDK